MFQNLLLSSPRIKSLPAGHFPAKAAFLLAVVDKADTDADNVRKACKNPRSDSRKAICEQSNLEKEQNKAATNALVDGLLAFRRSHDSLPKIHNAFYKDFLKLNKIDNLEDTKSLDDETQLKLDIVQDMDETERNAKTTAFGNTITAMSLGGLIGSIASGGVRALVGFAMRASTPKLGSKFFYKYGGVAGVVLAALYFGVRSYKEIGYAQTAEGIESERIALHQKHEENLNELTLRAFEADDASTPPSN